MTTPQEAARTALEQALGEGLLVTEDGELVESLGEAAVRILAALQADPDAARAVVALLGGVGRELDVERLWRAISGMAAQPTTSNEALTPRTTGSRLSEGREPDATPQETP